MFSNLPEPLKRQILSYLEADNFLAAKELRDHWLSLDQSNDGDEYSSEE